MFLARPPSSKPIECLSFRGGLAPISGQGFINRSGEMCLTNQGVQSNWPFSEGLAKVYVDGTKDVGFIDQTGNQVLGPYSWYGSDAFFDAGLIRVFPDKSTIGVFDRHGKWAVSPIPMTKFVPYHSGWFIYQSSDKWRFRNLLTSVTFDWDAKDELIPFSEGLCVAARPGDFPIYTAITEKGEIAFQIEANVDLFELEGVFHDGLIQYRDLSGQRRGYLDRFGNVQIPGQFRCAYPFRDGLAPVCPLDSVGWGYIDKSGQWAIQPREEFLHADCFSEQFAAVCTFRGNPDVGDEGTFDLRDNWGYIDLQGNWILPPVFCRAGPFREGLANVAFRYFQDKAEIYDEDDFSYSSHECFITPQGKFIWPPELAGRNIQEFIDAAPAWSKDKPQYHVVLPE